MKNEIAADLEKSSGSVVLLRRALAAAMVLGLTFGCARRDHPPGGKVGSNTSPAGAITARELLQRARFDAVHGVPPNGVIGLELTGDGGGHFVLDFDRRRVVENGPETECTAVLAAKDYVGWARGETTSDALLLAERMTMKARPPGDKPFLPPEHTKDPRTRVPSGCFAPGLSLEAAVPMMHGRISAAIRDFCARLGEYPCLRGVYPTRAACETELGWSRLESEGACQSKFDATFDCERNAPPRCEGSALRTDARCEPTFDAHRRCRMNGSCGDFERRLDGGKERCRKECSASGARFAIECEKGKSGFECRCVGGQRDGTTFVLERCGSDGASSAPGASQNELDAYRTVLDRCSAPAPRPFGWPPTRRR